MSIDWTKEITANMKAEEAEAALEAQLETVAKQRATELAQRKAADELLDTLPDEDVETLTYLYPRWDGDGVAYETDHKFRWNGVLYKVLQDHTSQPDWTPDTATSLYVRFRDPAQGPQPWVQPAGAHDAYATGEQVTHDNPNDGGNIWIYESAIDANTTEPGRDGTFDRYWTPVSVAT